MALTAAEKRLLQAQVEVGRECERKLARIKRADDAMWQQAVVAFDLEDAVEPEQRPATTAAERQWRDLEPQLRAFGMVD